MDSFTYLGSIITIDRVMEEDVKARIGKARTAFNILNNIWKTLKTKLKFFNSNVKSILLYRYKTWIITTNILNKL